MSDPNPADVPQAFPLQDPTGDENREHTHHHDPESEVTHAWEHFRENNIFFLGGFLPVILLTIIAFCVNFGDMPLGFSLLGYHVHLGTGNLIAALVLAALRSGLIAYFLSRLFKEFSFVFRTLFFTFIFLLGMIFLSLWDSEVHGIGNPIKDIVHPETDKV